MRLQLVLATRLTLRRARLVRDAIAISLSLFRTSRTLSFPHSFAPLRRGQATTVSRCSSATSDEDADREDTLISQFAPQTAGFVLASSRLSEERIMAHFARRPIVLINRDIARLPRVLIDGARGVEAAVDHLAVLGHSRIAYISGPAGSWSNQRRRRAIREGTRRREMELFIIQSRAPTYEAGSEAADPLCASTATAAIAFDDLVAQGLIAGLAAKGVGVRIKSASSDAITCWRRECIRN